MAPSPFPVEETLCLSVPSSLGSSPAPHQPSHLQPLPHLPSQSLLPSGTTPVDWSTMGKKTGQLSTGPATCWRSICFQLAVRPFPVPQLLLAAVRPSEGLPRTHRAACRTPGAPSRPAIPLRPPGELWSALLSPVACRGRPHGLIATGIRRLRGAWAPTIHPHSTNIEPLNPNRSSQGHCCNPSPHLGLKEQPSVKAPAQSTAAGDPLSGDPPVAPLRALPTLVQQDHLGGPSQNIPL